MLIAPRTRPAQQRLQQRTMPAPLNGLDLASPISAPRPGTAIKLDNMICRTDGIHTRNGYTVAHTLGSAVRSFIPFQRELFVATDDAINWEGSPAVTGLFGGDWSSAIIANPGGQHLVAVNGADDMRHYDGVDWDVPTVEGINTQTLFSVVSHQRRLFFAESNRLRLWYLNLNAFAGPAYPIMMDAQFRRGGAIAAISSMLSDGGKSRDDMLAVVTTEGELALWSGIDPSRASTWSLVGVFQVGKPVGKHAFCQIGGALALITDEGVVSVPAILSSKSSERAIKSMSLPVDSAVTSPTQMIDSPSARLSLLQDGAQQWIMSDTGGWSRWDLPATTWCEHDGNLYFGQSDGRVCRYEGAIDHTTPITSWGIDTFKRFGTPGRKTWKRVRLMMSKPLRYQPAVKMYCDDQLEDRKYDSEQWAWHEIHYSSMPMPWKRTTSRLTPLASTSWSWSDVSWAIPASWERDKTKMLEPWQSLGRNGVTGALSVAMRSETPLIWTGYDIAFNVGGARGR